MKTTRIIATAKKGSLALIAIILLTAFQSCATKAQFLTSTVVPAAEGKVTIKQNKNSNYIIKMSISNLAEIDRLQPVKTGYVVWMEADQAYTRNIGMVTSSSNLNVSFETTATLKPTRIFITAEEDGTVQYPGSMVVLTTGVINK
jgi:hypothetical protein